MVVGAAEEMDVAVVFVGEEFFVLEDGAVFGVCEDEIEVGVLVEESLVSASEAADVFVGAVFANVEEEVFAREFGGARFCGGDVGGFVGDGDFFWGDVCEFDEVVFCVVGRGDDVSGLLGGEEEGNFSELLFGFEVEPVLVVVISADEGEVVEGGDGAAAVEDGLLGHAEVDEVRV